MNGSSQWRLKSGGTIFLWAALTLFVVGTLFAGAWWGFPVQDDNYLVRLIRMVPPSASWAAPRWDISHFAQSATSPFARRPTPTFRLTNSFEIRGLIR